MRHLFALALTASFAACAGQGPSGAPRTAPDATPATPAASPSPLRTRVIGYVAGWGVRSKGTRIAELPGEHLTHVIYAFAGIGADGRMIHLDTCADIGRCRADSTGAALAAGGNFAQLRELKRRHPHLKILVAVGGWTGSARFSDVALTDSTRQAFAASGIDIFIRRHAGLIDGIDVDWEFPVSGGLPTNTTRPDDRRNFTLLLRELRRQLDAEGARDGRTYLLTAATIAGASGLRNIEADSVARVLDWLNVMTYDYHSGSKVAHFNAPLHSSPGDPTPYYNVDSTVAIYRRAGVPAEKIVVGIPFYGRGYAGVPAASDGLFQPATGAAPQEWGGPGIDWRLLRQRRPEENGFKRFWSDSARVPWLHNPSTGIWISYDDPASVRAKVDFARAKGLAGVMIWELGGDDGTLLRAIGEAARR